MMAVLRKNENGQVALILVLAATVAGSLVISLASRSTANLRSQTLDTERVKAFKGAESGVEEALLSGGSVSQSLGDDGTSFSASYVGEGAGGFVSEMVAVGDVIDILVEGADSSLSQLRIYFSSESGLAALKMSEYRADEASGQYLMNSYAVDGDGTRKLANHFSDPVDISGFDYKGVVFANRSDVSVSAGVAPTTRLLRILVLYSPTKIGVEPVGGDLPEQTVTVSSTGSYSVVGGDATVKKKLELRKEMEKVPVVFDNVLYSNAKLIQ